jgi:flavin reductase ActVB
MADELKDVMARFPTGVAIVTTRDETGSPHGLTVSSFCSVSLDPPLVLVCVAKSANCFPVFVRARDFAVSILRERHVDLARRFAKRSADKFAGGGFVRTPRGSVIVDNALAAVECSVERQHDAGDHVILVGGVVDQLLADAGQPAVYFDRQFTAINSTNALKRLV